MSATSTLPTATAYRGLYRARPPVVPLAIQLPLFVSARRRSVPVLLVGAAIVAFQLFGLAVLAHAYQSGPAVPQLTSQGR